MIQYFTTLMPSEIGQWWDRLQQYGVGAELAFAEHFNKDTYGAWLRQEAPGVAKDAAGRNVPLSVHAYYFAADLGALDETIRAHGVACLEQDIEIARVLGAKRVILHTGYLPESMDWYREWWTDTWCAAFERPVNVAQQAGVQLCVENVFEADPAIITNIIQRFDSPHVAACVDVGHANARKTDPVAWVHPWVSALHLHDNNGMGDQHKAPGAGNIDFAAVRQALGAGFDGQATLEVFGDEQALVTGLAHLRGAGWV